MVIHILWDRLCYADLVWHRYFYCYLVRFLHLHGTDYTISLLSRKWPNRIYAPEPHLTSLKKWHIVADELYICSTRLQCDNHIKRNRKNSIYSSDNITCFVAHGCDEIAYPFPNSNDGTVEIWEWMINFIPHDVLDPTPLFFRITPVTYEATPQNHHKILHGWCVRT